MKQRLILILMALMTSAAAFASTTLTINVSSFSGGTSPGALVRIDLQNCANAHVVGTGQVVPQTQTVTPVGGTVTVTLFSNTDTTGGGQILCAPSQLPLSYYSFNFIYQGVITSVGSYNLTPGTFNLSSLLACVGAACIGNGSGQSMRLIAGPNITLSPTNGLGNVTISSTGGAAGNPAGVNQDVQVNLNSTSFGADSGNLTNNTTTHNFAQKSINGLPDALKNQTTPTSNDGIKNILSSTLLFANVGPTYPAVEAVTGSSPFFRVPIVNATTDFYFENTPPYAEVTGFQDNRLSGQFGWSALGQFFYDPQSTPFGTSEQPTVYNRIYHDDQPQSAGPGNTWVGWQTDCSWQGSGKMETGIPDVHKCLQIENVSMVRGIDSPFTIQGYRVGAGDYQNVGNDTFFQGNSIYGGDEGTTNYRNQSIETSVVYTSHATSTLAHGATTIVVNKVGNGIGGDAMPAIDTTQASAQFLITAHTAPPSDTIPGTLTTDATWTPDTKGLVTTDLSSAVPQQYNGATTQVSINVTGLTAPLTASPSGVGDACFAKDSYIESAHIVSVGTFSGGNQTAVVNLRYPYRANSVIEQGPNACHYVEFLANQINNGFGVQAPLRNYTRVIGCPSAHVCDYASPIAGFWSAQPQGAFQNILLPLGTLTRDGAGHVSAPLIGITFSSIFNGMRIRISGASDSSFNGDFVVSQTGFSSITLSWAQTGGAATAASGLIVPVLVNTGNFSGGVFPNASVMYPGAEVVNQANPTTHAVDGTFLVEANAMTIASGDQIEIQHGNEPISNLEHNLVQQWTPIGSPESMNEEFLDGFMTDGYSRFRINVTVPFNGQAEYLGAGGTRNPTLQLFNIQGAGIWNTYFTIPAPTHSLFAIASCPLSGCTQQADPWNILQIVNGHAAFAESWSEWNQVWSLQDQHTNLSINPSGLFSQANDLAGHTFLNQMTASFLDFSMNGPSGQNTDINQTGDQIENTVTNAGATIISHFIQLPASFSLDKPLTIVGTSDGCATFSTGVLGSTGSACGSGGGTGFPITLGSTSISGSSTTTSVAGLTVNGVVLNAAGSATLFLNQAGGYTSPAAAAVASVSNSDGTLTISPTTGAVVASLALGHANTWTGLQTLVATNITGLPLTTGITGILGPNHGGTGINNSATLTLGSANQNWATIGTGIVKVTTTTGAISDAASADIIALWSGTCSSSTFLRGDGACAAASGSAAWSALGNPTTNLALTMGSDTTVFTYGATTSTPDLMKWTDTASNTGTGIMGHFTTASGSTEIPWQADSNGVGWKVGADGSLTGVGSSASHGMRIPAGTALTPGATTAGITSDSSGDLLGWTAGGTVKPILLGTQYSTGSCTEAWGGSGTSFALTSGDDAISNNTCYNDSGVTRTITAVKCRSSIASNTTTVNPTFGSAGTGTTILSGALTCGSSFAYSSTGTVTNASWTTGSGITPAMGGTLTGVSIAMIVEYTF